MKRESWQEEEGDMKSTGKNTLERVTVGILLEIQRDVNIPLYIEPVRDKVKKFSPAKRKSGVVFPSFEDSAFLYLADEEEE